MIKQDVKEVILTELAAREWTEYFRANLPDGSLVLVFGKTIEKDHRERPSD